MQKSISIFEQETLNFAHRGFTVSAPENSLAAFQAALELGVDGIELDVRTCKTGEVVVFHDPTLARMTNGRGFIKGKTLTELKSLRLNSQNPELSQRIPTLEEVLELVNGRIILNVEIKTKGLPKDHIENKVVAILRQYGIENKTIISSFNPIVIRRLRKINDQLLTGFLMDRSFSVRYSEIPLTKLSGAKAIHLENSLAKDSIIRKIQEFGFFCVVWSVNDPNVMQHLIDLGVNAIITDKPNLLKSLKKSAIHV
ncbi:MAG: glycerophosphodiester phosphodiesterase [bacterium]